jgi:hypothetical protein
MEYDHWHRTGDDEGRPYQFVSPEILLMDFETQVERILAELNIGTAVVGESDISERRP